MLTAWGQNIKVAARAVAGWPATKADAKFLSRRVSLRLMQDGKRKRGPLQVLLFTLGLTAVQFIVWVEIAIKIAINTNRPWWECLFVSDGKINTFWIIVAFALSMNLLLAYLNVRWSRTAFCRLHYRISPVKQRPVAFLPSLRLKDFDITDAERDEYLGSAASSFLVDEPRPGLIRYSQGAETLEMPVRPVGHRTAEIAFEAASLSRGAAGAADGTGFVHLAARRVTAALRYAGYEACCVRESGGAATRVEIRYPSGAFPVHSKADAKATATAPIGGGLPLASDAGTEAHAMGAPPPGVAWPPARPSGGMETARLATSPAWPHSEKDKNVINTSTYPNWAKLLGPFFGVVAGLVFGGVAYAVSASLGLAAPIQFWFLLGTISAIIVGLLTQHHAAPYRVAVDFGKDELRRQTIWGGLFPGSVRVVSLRAVERAEIFQFGSVPGVWGVTLVLAGRRGRIKVYESCRNPARATEICERINLYLQAGPEKQSGDVIT